MAVPETNCSIPVLTQRSNTAGVNDDVTSSKDWKICLEECGKRLHEWEPQYFGVCHLIVC